MKVMLLVGCVLIFAAADEQTLHEERETNSFYTKSCVPPTEKVLSNIKRKYLIGSMPLNEKQ
jgi:hypothetical protein